MSASAAIGNTASPSNRSRAFSLIELLAVMAIIAVLVALLLPAVQVAREAARRTRCLANLHQLGVAFHNYHELHLQLPPVYVAVRNTILPEFLGVSGTYDDANIHTYGEYVLPFLDQHAIYENIDFNQPHFAPVDLTPIGLPNYTSDNQSVLAVSVPVFLCSSAPRQEKTHSFVWDGDLPIAVSYRNGGNDYGPSAGIKGPGLLAFAPPQAGNLPGEGILSNNIPSSRFALATDGTSSTALMWEIAGRPEVWQVRKKIGGAITRGGGWADFLNGEHWFTGSLHDGSSVPGPCAVNCTNRFEGGIYSFHPGGAHLLVCDGSARFINENVNVGTFVQLVTFAGQTPVGEF